MPESSVSTAKDLCVFSVCRRHEACSPPRHLAPANTLVRTAVPLTPVLRGPALGHSKTGLRSVLLIGLKTVGALNTKLARRKSRSGAILVIEDPVDARVCRLAPEKRVPDPANLSD